MTMRDDIAINRLPRLNAVSKFAVATLLVMTLVACAAGSADAEHAAHAGLLSTFVLGFWHGLIAPVTLVVEVINQVATRGALPWSPHFYQEGAGVAYDVGFFIGIIAGPSILWSGSWRRR
jgi:hypothetical protein